MAKSPSTTAAPAANINDPPAAPITAPEPPRRRALQEAPPLPANIDDWTRHIKAERTLNDLVEDIHRSLVGDEKTNERYRALLRAVYDTQAVEGSLAADNIMAAMMIRERAENMEGMEEVRREKLATINQCLGVVLRRYRATRKQRRQTLGGEEVPTDNGD